MKQSTKGLIASLFASLLMFGSVAYSYAISVHKTEFVKNVTLDVIFVNPVHN